ncbi:MAG: UDP-N-acetylglucosamine--N-acetylmuramyl-(pentapeptide) pyrophosphoryl-undecaprenol N-acetylglucosamine transferase [Pedosphaera sp.]|nr:UDP-N-acetylglucosamine--N-acetylmuramyl-(pentapeptide) pyrophosphoryl-undecaprenol N-acetylglucosamine transferase [Pedosphaera sp.]MSU43179.1 UDP-N-acetylglucosamine--N-acetylmuramyl-(pentapeptide) pyrophosphoryl-undecaprenol N-acetylglucosamine transferase [Pedosphaera sp.]
MSGTTQRAPQVYIACGGTGGHFFPGVAVARELQREGAVVTLLISGKRIDQQTANSQRDFPTRELPAVSWQPRAPWRFVRGLLHSLRALREIYRQHPPDAVLSMGGFTSAAPVLLGRALGAPVFIHESNTIPGRANRLLAPLADKVFVGFDCARHRFLHTTVETTGTPVRGAFSNLDKAASCIRLGLDPHRPVLLIMGGSQGARAINHLALAAVPQWLRAHPSLQFLHLCGDGEDERVRGVYHSHHATAQVHAFYADMPAALGAADVAVGRAGASSLAEIAAARLPALLVPLPTSADDHQRHNAREFAAQGAALVLEQTANPSEVSAAVQRLLASPVPFRLALGAMDAPQAASRVAAQILSSIQQPSTADRQHAWKGRIPNCSMAA